MVNDYHNRKLLIQLTNRKYNISNVMIFVHFDSANDGLKIMDNRDLYAMKSDASYRCL